MTSDLRARSIQGAAIAGRNIVDLVEGKHDRAVELRERRLELPGGVS